MQITLANLLTLTTGVVGNVHTCSQNGLRPARVLVGWADGLFEVVLSAVCLDSNDDAIVKCQSICCLSISQTLARRTKLLTGKLRKRTVTLSTSRVRLLLVTLDWTGVHVHRRGATCDRNGSDVAVVLGLQLNTWRRRGGLRSSPSLKSLRRPAPRSRLARAALAAGGQGVVDSSPPAARSSGELGGQSMQAAGINASRQIYHITTSGWDAPGTFICDGSRTRLKYAYKDFRIIMGLTKYYGVKWRG